MDYSKMFTDDAVLDDLEAGEMEGVLEDLVKGLCKAHKVSKALAKEIREGLQKKLEQGATGAIGHGIAVPHVKIPSADRTLAVMGRTRGGIDFLAADGVPASLFFLVVGPEDAPEEHLGFMRWVAGIARNDDFRRFALACKGRKELRDLLKEMSQAR